MAIYNSIYRPRSSSILYITQPLHLIIACKSEITLPTPSDLDYLTQLRLIRKHRKHFWSLIFWIYIALAKANYGTLLYFTNTVIKMMQLNHCQILRDWIGLFVWYNIDTSASIFIRCVVAGRNGNRICVLRLLDDTPACREHLSLPICNLCDCIGLFVWYALDLIKLPTE